jgi:hypothetical protein
MARGGRSSGQRFNAWALVAALAFGLGACGGGGDGGAGVGNLGAPISNQTLSGKIDGQPWTFVAGETDSSLSQGSDKLFATLFDQPITTACTGFDPPDSDHRLILNIPKAVGTYALSLSLNQTFSYSDASGTSQNDIATSGVLQVTNLTDTTLQGGVRMQFGSNDSVEGMFQITVCNM